MRDLQRTRDLQGEEGHRDISGAARALYNLEDYLKRVGFEIFDLVPVTRFSKDHKLPMLEAAGRRLAEP